MKIFAVLAMFLGSSGVAIAQTLPSRNELESSSYHPLLRSMSDPATACAGATAATANAYPDPDDCSQFYYCTDTGEATPPFALQCGDPDKCFDPATSDCSEDTDACRAACETNGPTCKETCGKFGEQLSHPTDCNIRYLCDVNNKPVEMHCFDAARPFFNGYECVADETQCCTCRKRTCYGATSGDLLVDTDDCHSFYVCIGNPLEPVGPNTCQGGGVFDPTTKQCDSNNKECSNSCNIDGGVTPDCSDIGSFRCPGKGFYARCTYCDPSYFSCDSLGGSPIQGACSGEWIFNPNPEYPYCVLPQNCPISG